ncbi:MAG: hypothetical protein K940chlam6_00070 [Chlamydiae bacterium]|nr:hypothetical protein [Chlamydiota bacterium]
MTTELSTKFLSKKEACSKYSFLTENTLKNLLFKNTGGFREKVAKKLGRKIILDEEALIRFLNESK